MKLSTEEVQKLRAATTHGTCWTEDTECRNCTSLPMCNAVRNLIDTIEAQQQEIESLRNWNACEVKEHERLIESDIKRIGLEADIEKMDTALERATRGIKSIIEQYTTDFTEDELLGDVLCPREKVVLEYAHETLELLEAVGGREK